MPSLDLLLVRKLTTAPVRFEVCRMINAGYVGRDQKAVKAHIEELAREGIAPPPSVPVLFPVLSNNLTTASRIEVVEDRTSGEVEFILLLQAGRMWVGVGSDHTDRHLEANSMLNSKQVCPNVMSKQVWDYDEIRDHWDEIVLQSWTRTSTDSDPILYQKAPLAKILSATDLLTLVKSRMTKGDCEGLVIFSGTIPILTREMICGSFFRCELIDPVLNRQLACEYSIDRLNYLAGSVGP
jgi:hypothetical protein